MRAVVPVLEPQPMPVDRGLHVALVLGVDDDLRPLLDLQGRAGDRAVVAEHPNRRVADPLGHRRDAQVELVAVGQLDHLRGPGRGKPAYVGGEVVGGAHALLLSVEVVSARRLAGDQHARAATARAFERAAQRRALQRAAERPPSTSSRAGA